MPLSNAGTGSSAAALITNSTHPYFAFPFSLPHLPAELEKGLLAPALMGTLSLLSSVGLLVFLLTKYLEWKKRSKSWIGYNQYLVLFINLLIADAQQGIAFVMSYHWMRQGSILAPTPACFAQGWFLNIGDVSSALFVLFIAVHTFYTTLVGRRIDHGVFVRLVLATWFFALFLTFIGPAIHGRTYFVRTGAWCWVSALYETERLAVHYIWVFFVEFGALLIYLVLFVHIKLTVRRTGNLLSAGRATSSSTPHRKINRAARAMVLYPLTYILLTLPLSAGRMWSLAHAGTFLPNTYLLVAGSLMASSGFVDACLYAFTRRTLMQAGNTTDPHKSAGTPAHNTASVKDRAAGATAATTTTDADAPQVPPHRTATTPKRGGDPDDPPPMAMTNVMVMVVGEDGHQKQQRILVDDKTGVQIVTRPGPAAVTTTTTTTTTTAAGYAAMAGRDTKRSSSVAVLPNHGFVEGSSFGGGSRCSSSSSGSSSSNSSSGSSSSSSSSRSSPRRDVPRPGIGLAISTGPDLERGADEEEGVERREFERRDRV